MRYRSLMTAVGMLLANGAVSVAEEIEVPKGTKLDFVLVSPEIRADLPNQLTEPQFKARLAQGGTFSLSGGDLVLGPADYQNPKRFFMALDTLELKNGARIVTNGNLFVLFVNKLISEDGAIVTFRDDERRATTGAIDSSGEPGIPGRLVSIHVIQTLTGILHTDLGGQAGGTGGPGHNGADGTRGPKGENASWSFLPFPPFCNCNHGGGGGGVGTPGLPGAKGGTGGNGGEGGILELYNIGNEPIPDASYTFAAAGGAGGDRGAAGRGGHGGQGGEGGNGGGCCGGGPPGPDGPGGSDGPSGDPGKKAADGQKIVKNLKLEYLLGHLVQKDTSVFPKSFIESFKATNH